MESFIDFSAAFAFYIFLAYLNHKVTNFFPKCLTQTHTIMSVGFATICAYIQDLVKLSQCEKTQ